MAVFSPPRGLIIDLIAPLKGNGEIDGRGLGKHLDRVIPYAQALFLAGPYMGQGVGLSPEQRGQLLEKTLVVVQGRLPIMVWISQATADQSRETLLLLEKRLGAREYSGRIFWVDTPLYYHSNRGLPLHYQQMSSLTKNPLLLHNDPDLVKQLDRPLKRSNIRTSILKELVQIRGIAGLIHQGSIDRARHYHKATSAKPDFRIYDGNEANFLMYPSLSGVVSGGANLAPRAWQNITASSLHVKGDHGDFPDRQQQIWEQGEYLDQLKGLYQDNAVPLIKHVLYEMGVLETPSSPSGGKEAGEKVKLLMDLIQSHGDWV
ncbi:dihydrodipicolinate synthase family protein [Thermodesulfobacteriota bacterium]